MELSGLDLMALMSELKVLEGAIIELIYQRNRELIIHAYKPGDKKYRLLLGSGKAFFTKYKREMPHRPPNFCMFLRKYLNRKKITKVRQKGTDRILEIYTENHILICELFGDANFILTDKDRVIQAAMTSRKWKDRSIFRGETYDSPPSGVNLTEITEDDLRTLFSTDKEVVRALASLTGGNYAEEILFRAQIDKKTAGNKISKAGVRNIYRVLKDMIERVKAKELKPQLYRNVAATPFPFKKYEVPSEDFATFSEALDEFYSSKEESGSAAREESTYDTNLKALEIIRRQQKQAVEELLTKSEESRKLADLIYRNYSVIEDVINTIRGAMQRYETHEILKILGKEKEKGNPQAELIQKINFKDKTVKLELEKPVLINFKLNVEQNAENYYEKSKEAKRKLEGAKKSLKETEEKIKNLSMEEKKGSEPTLKKYEYKTSKWYYKFRWFYSSDNFLVLGGRDATSNEILVKKHLEKNDMFVHVDFPGGPCVIIKNPENREIPQSTLKEAAKLAVTYSKLWKEKIGSESAYYVNPEQVTKAPESGEYLAKGAFVIRGKRNYLNVEVDASVGVLIHKEGHEVMGGPLSAIKKHCKFYVVVIQGHIKKSECAKKIKRYFKEKGVDVDLDTLMQSLPPGECKIDY